MEYEDNQNQEMNQIHGDAAAMYTRLFESILLAHGHQHCEGMRLESCNVQVITRRTEFVPRTSVLAHSSCDDWRRYKQLDHSGDDLLSCSALACRLHDFGLPDRKIEKLIYQARAAAAPCCYS